MAKMLKNFKNLDVHSAKEKRLIEIPKYLYGFTCETRATVDEFVPVNNSYNISPAHNMTALANITANLNKDESL
jgi:hypothetical protein